MSTSAIQNISNAPQAPVVASGIVNQQHRATDEMVRIYCNGIIDGKPTGKVFPARLSEMIFTEEQREEIRAARATHKLDCVTSKAQLLHILRSKKTQTVGHRTNKAGTSGAIKYVKDAFFLDRKGKFAARRHESFFFGKPSKA